MLITDRKKEECMPSPSKTKHRTSSVKFFGVELCPDNVAVAMVYFVQGVLGLARLAVRLPWSATATGHRRFASRPG